MRWSGPRLTIGFAVALVVSIVTCILWAQGSLTKEPALLTLAVCSITLDSVVPV